MMANALKRFTEKNKVPPAVLFILRDGLSDGKFVKVGREESKDVQDMRKLGGLYISDF